MRILKAADLFCGGGGTSQGAEASGAAKVVFAVNHWPLAIETHSANFPGAKHVCASLDKVSPSECPKIDLLFASPECTHHSRARGGKPVNDQKRAQAWDVLKWAEHLRPSYIVVENVTEFEDWGPLDNNGRPLKSGKGKLFQAWVKAIEAAGYRAEWRRLNAANFGARTSRTRLFVIARKGRRSINWPEPTHCQDPDGMLPGFRLPRWRPAAEIIDWSIPCPSIFGRKRPLAPKTLLRIEAGLRRFCTAENLEAYLVKLRSHETAESADRPLSTVTAGGLHHALAMPYVFSQCSGGAPRDTDQPIPTLTTTSAPWLALPFAMQFNSGAGRRTRSLEDPLPTIIAGATRHSLVMPYFVARHGERPGQEPRTHGADAPLPTIATSNHPSLAVPYLMHVSHGENGEKNGRTADINRPIATLTTSHDLALVQAFAVKYYSTGAARPLDEPLDTVTTHDRYGLAMVKLIETMRRLSIVDIGFRMLTNAELARATGFPAGYYFAGVKSEVTKQIGNAVPPPFAEAITTALAA